MMQDAPGLPASPPVGYILYMARRGCSPPVSPSSETPARASSRTSAMHVARFLTGLTSAALRLVLSGRPASTPNRARGLGRPAAEADVPKPRVVVTTDPELDDSNSLLRYLLYSTDFR